MTARYYVQDEQVWMINAPGAGGDDSEVLTEPVARLTVARHWCKGLGCHRIEAAS